MTNTAGRVADGGRGVPPGSQPSRHRAGPGRGLLRYRQAGYCSAA